jgi:DDE family transposase
MSHRDSGVAAVRLNASCLKLALGWLLRDVDWSGVNLRKDCTWTPRLLTAVALMWAWSDELTLVERFATARRLVDYLFSPAGPLAESYQCFTKLLRRWTDALIGCWQAALHERMRRELAGSWCVLGFVMFGVDGSRDELPRTRSHERAYSPTRQRKSRQGRKRCDRAYMRKANSPQLWLTTMWHVGTGLPWDWRIGPSDSSERAHLREMLPQLPPEALITADAGFVGYESLRAILDSQRQLLIRVGSNVRLLKKLGYARREWDNTVYLWPDSQRDRPPLVLRLVEAHNGRHPVFLVTSVLSKTRLTDRQVIELYARRWGIELFYRHLKQTFGRRKLRSTNAENALLELHWSLAGLWGMALYALAQFQLADLPPRRLSIAQTLRAFRRMMRDYLHPVEQGKNLRERLGAALIDPYHRRNKTSRNYPRKKQESPAGPPQIIMATNTQIEMAQSLRRDLQHKG